ncbi:MAG: HEAT repeat domain-containing protein, partial [Chthoniobacteraceae bacterium]
MPAHILLFSRIAVLFFAVAMPGFPGTVPAAEIEGEGATSHALQPSPRVPEPAYAKASDEAIMAMKKFQIPAGFTTSLWASEPMLGNPVAFSIDEQGRVFVAETFRYRTSVLDIRHYMFMLEDDLASRNTDDRIASTKKNFPDDWQKLEVETEVVRLLQDTDGDGRADKASQYAAGMSSLLDGINSGVLAFNGTVWCTNMPNLWRFSGITKDGAAEKRESLSFGYGVRYSFTGHDMHGLALGPDGRLYFSFGDRGAYVKTKEGKTLAYSDEGAVFRCEPDGSHLEAVYHGLRNPQELAFDNHGNLFTGDNDCDMGDRERWVYIVEGGDSGWRVGWQHPPLGKEHDMWLTENMWEPRKANTPAYILSPIMNIPDGPSGVTHYPGTGLPSQYDDAFFVCGFKGSSARSAISWWKVKEEGASFSVEKSPAAFVDNVQATDIDFGPDSKIYFTEWGEGWEGTGRGRIFRMDNAAALEQQAAQVAEVQRLIGGELAKKTSDELAALLGYPDQRIRLRAQFALAAKDDAAQEFLTVAMKGTNELARLHAIWGLGHIARLASYKTPDLGLKIVQPLVALLVDKDPEVRAQAAKVLGDSAATAAVETLTKALADPSPRVRFFAAQSLGKLGKPQVAESLIGLLRSNADEDVFIRHACIQGLINCGNAEALATAAKDPSKSVRLGALIAYRRLLKPEIAQFLNDPEPDLVIEAARAISDAGIAEAYPALAGLLSKPTDDPNFMLRVLNGAYRAGTAETAQALGKYASDDAQPEKLRQEAVEFLGAWPQPAARDRVAGVYRPLARRDAAPAVAALNAVLPKLLAGKSKAVATSAIGAVKTLGIKNAGASLMALLSRTDVPASVRAEALKALSGLGDPKLAAAVKLAMADKDPALRVEAIGILGKLNPDEAVKELMTTFPTAATPEKKQIIDFLAGIKGAHADAAIATLLGEMKTGRIPDEAKLEVLEAARKRDSAVIKEKLSEYENSLPAGDLPAQFSF